MGNFDAAMDADRTAFDLDTTSVLCAVYLPGGFVKTDNVINCVIWGLNTLRPDGDEDFSDLLQCLLCTSFHYLERNNASSRCRVVANVEGLLGILGGRAHLAHPTRASEPQ